MGVPEMKIAFNLHSTNNENKLELKVANVEVKEREREKRKFYRINWKWKKFSTTKCPGDGCSGAKLTLNLEKF